MQTNTSAHETIIERTRGRPGRSPYAELHELRVSIAVVDESTHVQHLVRTDRARTRVPRARSRRRARRPTVDTPPPVFDEPLNAGRYSTLKMPHIYPVEGGIPVIVHGQWVGAIGVASVLPHLDAAVADAGRKALDRSDLAMAPTGRLTGVSYSKDLRG
jgi:glc operon protein GlcG